MDKKTGVIILGHGSRRRQAHSVLQEIISEIRKNNDFGTIESAYLQISRPDISTAVRKIVNQGCGKIVIVPFFLFMGNHVSRDIPRAIAREKKRYKDTEFIYTRNLGRDPRIAGIVKDCIKDALMPGEIK